MTREAVELAIEEHLRRGEHDAAATLILRTYGLEVMRFLVAMTRTLAEADDAFSHFSLFLWQSLPAFRGDCSPRTWAYALARNAIGRVHDHRVRHRAEVSLGSEAGAMAEHVRTATHEYVRTAAKDRLAEVRARLAPEDQMLLILRLNRRMSWPDVARAIGGEASAPEAPELARRAAALRKRFERLKQTLHDELAPAKEA